MIYFAASPMAFTIHWPRLLRPTLRILAAAGGGYLLAWLCLAWYVNTHRQELVAKLGRQLSERLHGDLHIGSMEPSVFRAFPDMSFVLKEVSLRDSLWYQHRHSLFEAKDMYVRVNPF